MLMKNNDVRPDPNNCPSQIFVRVDTIAFQMFPD